jgi:hypothetical protein
MVQHVAPVAARLASSWGRAFRIPHAAWQQADNFQHSWKRFGEISNEQPFLGYPKKIKIPYTALDVLQKFSKRY